MRLVNALPCQVTNLKSAPLRSLTDALSLRSQYTSLSIRHQAELLQSKEQCENVLQWWLQAFKDQRSLVTFGPEHVETDERLGSMGVNLPHLWGNQDVHVARDAHDWKRLFLCFQADLYITHSRRVMENYLSMSCKGGNNLRTLLVYAFLPRHRESPYLT